MFILHRMWFPKGAFMSHTYTHPHYLQTVDQYLLSTLQVPVWGSTKGHSS